MLDTSVEGSVVCCCRTVYLSTTFTKNSVIDTSMSRRRSCVAAAADLYSLN